MYDTYLLTCETFTVDLLTSKTDSLRGPLAPMCIKIGSFVYNMQCSRLVT